VASQKLFPAPSSKSMDATMKKKKKKDEEEKKIEMKPWISATPRPSEDKPIAMCVVGQIRNRATWQWRNLYERLIRPIEDHVDVFVVISDGENLSDRTPRDMGVEADISGEVGRLIGLLKPKRIHRFVAEKEGLIATKAPGDLRAFWNDSMGVKHVIKNCYYGVWQAFGLSQCYPVIQQEETKRGRPYRWSVRVRNDILPTKRVPPYHKWPNIDMEGPGVMWVPYMGIEGACGPGGTRDGSPSARACISDHFAIMTRHGIEPMFKNYWEAFRDCEPDPQKSFGPVHGGNNYLCPECTMGTVMSMHGLYKAEIPEFFVGTHRHSPKKIARSPEDEWTEKPFEFIGEFEDWYASCSDDTCLENVCITRMHQYEIPERRKGLLTHICKALAMYPKEVNLTLPTSWEFSHIV